LKVKVSQQFTFSLVLQVGGPSLSQVQVGIVESKSIPTVCFFWCCRLQWSIIIPSTSEVESKVSQQFFLVLQGCCPSLSQVQVELLKVKVSQQFVFSGAAGCAVPSLSQVQVEVLKVKVSQQLLFLVLQVVDHHYPNK
jgi:hypothetical protein